MDCFLLINNKQNSYRTGEVIAAYPADIELTDGIDKRTFEAAHPEKKWDRRSVLIKLIGTSFDDPKVLALLKDSVDGSTRRAKFLLPQDASSPYYLSLLNNAYIETTIGILETLIYV